MLSKVFPLNRNQKGFTLAEILVAVAITAVIGSVITMSISQLFTVSIADKNRMEAVKQVENALHYINRDAQMAKAFDIIPGSSVPFTSGLHLQWIDYDISSEINNTVDYTLDADGDLKRVYWRAGDTVTTTVARHIESVSNYSFDGAVLVVNLTASVEGLRSATESRTLQVKPRIN